MNGIDMAWIALLWLGAGVLLMYEVFIYYLALMNLKRARDQGLLTWPAKLLGYPALMVGYTLDALLTITVGTLLFIDWPREMTFSQRLGRYCTDPLHNKGWRKRIAIWFARHLLNPYDPRGFHIPGSV